MWAFIKPINLIRYLVVWRINSNLVWQPNWLPVDLSLTLGTIIANRLPTTEVRPWRKALTPWEDYYRLFPTQEEAHKDGSSSKKKKKISPIPEASWPISCVLFAYPGKITYGQGELLFWELKLFGADADHNLFLEVILPAMEEASITPEAMTWHQKYSFWGHFDVYAVYAARGWQWEPVIQDGKLDLNYRPTPFQWTEGINFGGEPSQRRFNQITWLTPFDFGETPVKKSRQSRRRKKKTVSIRTPTLRHILDALMVRTGQLLPGKYNTSDDVWALLNQEEQSALQGNLEQARRIPVHHHEIKQVPKHWPGRWIGAEMFPSIPQPLMPYLELASILHIGKQTHFGCGMFMIGDYR
jgi:hypothetical protein